MCKQKQQDSSMAVWSVYHVHILHMLTGIRIEELIWSVELLALTQKKEKKKNRQSLLHHQNIPSGIIT